MYSSKCTSKQNMGNDMTRTSLTSSSPVAVFTESMLWLKVTAKGASISWSWTETEGLFDSESSRALFKDGGVAAEGGDRSPRGCRPLFVMLETVSTIYADGPSPVLNRPWSFQNPLVHQYQQKKNKEHKQDTESSENRKNLSGDEQRGVWNPRVDYYGTL